MSEGRLTRILDRLEPLVAADTQNPPRGITANHPLVTAVRQGLPEFEISVEDLGQGRLIIDCRRGDPAVLFNVHMDTVPAGPTWTRDPFSLLRGEDRATGLGACDIKGAAAVLMVLAEDMQAPMRLVLTTDEEAGGSDCVRQFLKKGCEAELAVIAEPTGAEAVMQHRGIVSSVARFSGVAGHASQGGGRSAVHEAIRFLAKCLDTDTAAENRFNAGRIEGGVKANMVAARCEVNFGLRIRPGEANEAVLKEIRGHAPHAEHETRFSGPSLPCNEQGKAAQEKAASMLAKIGIEPAAPVDFWTEASLFAEAGVPAVVLGPGHIAQAHTADEWVAYDQLLVAYDVYARIVQA